MFSDLRCFAVYINNMVESIHTTKNQQNNSLHAFFLHLKMITTQRFNFFPTND